LKNFMIILSLFLLAGCTGSHRLISVEAKSNIGVGNGYYDGYDDGKAAANKSYSANDWIYIGFLGGISSGFIGGAVAILIAEGGSVYPPIEFNDILQWKPYNYQMGYNAGYSKQAKEKRTNATLIGSLTGIGVLIALIISVSN